MKQLLYPDKRWLILIAIQVWLMPVVRGQQYDIYVYDVKAGSSRKASNIPNSASFNATWSNNSKRIAHDVTGAAAWPYDQSIFITDVETGNSTPLAGAEGGNDAAWSPDGTSIAFDAFDFWTWTNNLYTVPAGGGPRRFLRSHSQHGSWSPKGDRIAFADNWFGYIGTMSLQGEGETFVAFGQWPSWSPNGQYIAFNGREGGVWVIGVNEEGIPQGNPVQLTTSGYGPSWKNNSQEIVYIDWPDGNPDLYAVPLSGGTPKRVYGRTDGFEKGDYDPAYSNNGQYIAYSSYTDFVPQLPVVTKATRATETNMSDALLVQNYPNPFSAQTRISFQLVDPTEVTLHIYNTSGQMIQTLMKGAYQPGAYTATWNGRDRAGRAVPNGTYFYRLQAGTVTRTASMSLLR